jgi:hypothetical protein
MRHVQELTEAIASALRDADHNTTAVSVHIKHMPLLCRAAFSGGMPPEESDAGFIPLSEVFFFFDPSRGIGFGPSVPPGCIEILQHAGNPTSDIVLREEEPVTIIEIYANGHVEVHRREP